MKKAEAELQAIVSGWLRQAQASEKGTDEKSGGAGRPRKNEPGTPKDSAQSNFTDPQSRIMKSHDGFIQGYNAAAAVDADSQVIVARTLTNNARISGNYLIVSVRRHFASCEAF